MAIKVQCETCGARLSLKDESKIGKKVKCPKCHSPILVSDPDDDFGDYGEPIVSAKKSDKKGKKKKKAASSGSGALIPLVIGGVVVLLLLVGGGIWFAMGQGGDGAVDVAQVGDESAGAEDGYGQGMGEDAGEPAEEEEEEAVAPEEPEELVTGINTDYLPSDTQYLIHLRPSEILRSEVVGRVLKTSFAKRMLESFHGEYGFELQAVEEITVGIAVDPDWLVTQLRNIQPALLASRGGQQRRFGGGRFANQYDDEGYDMSSDSSMGFGAYDDDDGYEEGYEEGYGDYDGEMSRGPARPSARQPARQAPDRKSGPGAVAVLRLSVDADPEKLKFLALGEDEPEEISGVRIYPVSNPNRNPGSGPGPQSSMGLVDARTLVFTTPEELAFVAEQKTSGMGNRFSFVNEEADFAFASTLDIVEKLQTALDQEETREGMAKVKELYDAGARGVYLALSLDAGADVSVGVKGKDDEAAAEIEKRMIEGKEGIEKSVAEAAKVNSGQMESVTDIVKSLAVGNENRTITLSANIGSEAFDELERQVSQMSAMLPLMAAGMGDRLPIEAQGLLGPGTNGIREIVDDLQAPVSIEGVPDGVTVRSVASWQTPDTQPDAEVVVTSPSPFVSTTGPGANPVSQFGFGFSASPAADKPSDLQVDLVLSGESAQNVVQYRQVSVAATVESPASLLKRMRPETNPYLTGDSWLTLEPVDVLGELGDAVAIPIRFSPPIDPVDAVAEISGEVVVQVAGEIETVELDLFDPGAAEIAETAGFRLLQAEIDEQTVFFVLPNSDEVAVVEVQQTEGISTPGGSGPPRFAGITGGAGYDDEEAMLAFGESDYDDGSDEGYRGDFGGYPGAYDGDESEFSGRRRPQAEPEPARPTRPTIALGVSRPYFWNTQGYQVNLGQERQGYIAVRLARGLSEQKLKFSFANLPVPPATATASGKSADIWTPMAADIELPEGFTLAEVNGQWEDPSGDDASRRTLQLHIDLWGPAATRVFSSGSYKIEECTADNGKRLILLGEHGSYVKRPGGFDPPDPLTTGSERPFGAFRTMIPVAALDPRFGSLQTVTGQFRVKVAAEQTPVTISSLSTFEDKRILDDDNVLRDDQILVQLIKNPEEEGQYVLAYSEKARDKVVAIDLLDQSGRVDPSVTAEYQTVEQRRGEKQIGYVFDIGERKIRSVGVRIVVNRGLETVLVPFKFENVPLPEIGFEDE